MTDFEGLDQSSAAFFSRVNEDKIRQLGAENEKLVQTVTTLTAENKQLRSSLSEIKETSESEVVMALADEALKGTGINGEDFLAQIRADLLEDEAMKIERAAQKLVDSSQTLEVMDKQVSDAYLKAAKRCSVHLKNTAGLIRESQKRH